MVKPSERVTSVLGPGINWKGGFARKRVVSELKCVFEGEISLRGMIVVGETGRVTCENLHANTVIIAGAVRGNITARTN